jgi:type III pantothenate kinase
MVGRPAPQKGWDYVAEALGRLESCRPDEAARVELAAIGGIGDWGGGFSDRTFQRFLGLKKVSLAKLGEIPNDAVMRVMASADALLLPSTFEPFGLVMLEAMASVIPVVRLRRPARRR